MNIFSLTILLFLSVSQSNAFQSSTNVRPKAPSTVSRLHRQKPQLRPCSELRALDGVGSALNDFVASQPYVAAFVTCAFKASAADLLAQTQQEPQDSDSSLSSRAVPTDDDDASSLMQFDMTRNLAFLFYGGLMQGMFQNWIFSSVYPSWFGTAVLPQVVFDITVMGPCVFIPMCYSLKSIFNAISTMKPETQISLTWLQEAVQTGLQKYYEDVTQRGLLRQFWSIWLPAQCLTFGVVPTHFRVIFVAMVSFFWVCLLSTVSSSTSTSTTKEAPTFVVHQQDPQHGSMAPLPAPVVVPVQRQAWESK